MSKTIFLMMLFTGTIAQAQVASFTNHEIAQHNKNIALIVSTATDCLDETYEDHLDFFALWDISKYYGDRNPKYATEAGRLAALKEYGKPPELIDQLEPISCIGLAMRCLERGFAAANMEDTWAKIYAQLKVGQKFYGTDLQKNLIKLGWKSYYWNPYPANNDKWDKEDQALNPLKPGQVWNPVWGGHAYRYNQAKKGYYYEKDLFVHDATSLVGYEDKQPAFFKEIPFFIGIAHAGYHVFPGRNGEVIEAHSTRLLNSKDNLEFSEFNPLKNGGGPKWTPKERYRSGVVVVPNM
ncbi:MAG: hypothetical protein IT287_00140 [Bdellovibrionaceae bacterium]|nr:hypothetical protein [Pseudobdellovibrionaceae bacterium]